MTRGTYHNLPMGSADRAVAKIANIANVNTVLGGASAMVKADRAVAMGLPNADRLSDAVSEVYGRSSGRVPDDLAVCACPECGQWHLGADAAAECCAPSDDDFGDE